MTPPFVLDTSALLAHYLVEPGQEVVGGLLADHPDQVFINVITWLEFQHRLREITRNTAGRAEALEIYGGLLNQALPVTRATAEAALSLRQECATRLPTSDALIAASAKLREATLVHRDPHFRGIPSGLLRQHMLPERA